MTTPVVTDRQCVVAFHLAILEALRESAAAGGLAFAIVQDGPGEYHHVAPGATSDVIARGGRVICYLRAPEVA